MSSWIRGMAGSGGEERGGRVGGRREEVRSRRVELRRSAGHARVRLSKERGGEAREGTCVRRGVCVA